MTIVTGVGKKFLEELPLGIHVLFEGAPSDTIMVALYGPNAILAPTIDTYVTSGEVSGGGYVAGGFEVTGGLTVVGSSGSSRGDGPQFNDPYINPTTDMNIAVTGIGIRGLMMYNASQGNRNIFVLDFGSTFSPSTGVNLAWGLSQIVSQTDVLIPLVGNEF